MSDDSVRQQVSDEEDELHDESPAYAVGLSEKQAASLTRRGLEGRRSRVLELQRLLFATALTCDDPSDRAGCSRAYDVLEDRLRVLDGKLKPGSINARDDSKSDAKPKRTSSKPFTLPASLPTVSELPVKEPSNES